jgi:hypothetical protein
MSKSTNIKGHIMILSHSSHTEGLVSAAGPCFAASSFSQRQRAGLETSKIDSPSLCQCGRRCKV